MNSYHQILAHFLSIKVILLVDWELMLSYIGFESTEKEKNFALAETLCVVLSYIDNTITITLFPWIILEIA